MNKTIQQKSWVAESVKQDWKRSTQYKFRSHAKKRNEQYHYEEDLVEQKAPGKPKAETMRSSPTMCLYQ